MDEEDDDREPRAVAMMMAPPIKETTEKARGGDRKQWEGKLVSRGGELRTRVKKIGTKQESI